MEVFEAIRQRKSIRQFSKDAVKKEDLLKIAEAARMSATSVNQKSRKFKLVHTQALIKKLDRALSSYGDSFYKAQAILLISSPRDNTYSQIELA